MLYSQGFIKDEELLIHCTVTPSAASESDATKKEIEDATASDASDKVLPTTPRGEAPKTYRRFHSVGDAYIRVHGFSSYEHGTIFSKWVPLEPFGRWRAICYPRGKTTFSDFLSIGYQIERTNNNNNNNKINENNTNNDTINPTTMSSSSSDLLSERDDAPWEVPSIVSAHIVPARKDSSTVATFDYCDVQTFTSGRSTIMNPTYVPVNDIRSAAESVLDDDTLTIRLSLAPFRATSPAKTAALRAPRIVSSAGAASAAIAAAAADAAGPRGAAVGEGAATALDTFGFLSERVEGAGAAYAQYARIYEAYRPALKELPALESRENELLGSCDDPERAKELSALIARTLKVLLEKLDAPDDDENAPKSARGQPSASPRESAERSPAADIEKDAPEAAPKTLKSGDAKLTPELPKEMGGLKEEVERMVRVAEEGSMGVRSMGVWDAMLVDEEGSLGKGAKEEIKEVEKLREGKEERIKRWSELRRRVSVLEGKKEAIEGLSKKEVGEFVELIEKARESLKKVSESK